jgi:hypothetical protein
VNIRTLRRDHPTWTWAAERPYARQVYVGRLPASPAGASREVQVYAVARLVDEDEFETEWRVDEGATAYTYLHWSLRESSHGRFE